MAIDISKIDNLLIDEGSEDTPFILTDTEVATLYKLAVSNNPKINIKGYVNTVSGTILKYQSYQIKKAWSDIHVLAREVTTQDWTIKLLSSSIIEGGETRLIATNIALETLLFNVRSVTCDRRSPEEIKPLIHFDRTTGRVYFDPPTSNLGWTATIVLEFWPEYIEQPTAEDYRTVQIAVRAIAVDNVTITAPSRIDESAISTITLKASPLDNTKGDKCKFSLQTTYGTVTPVGRTELSTFTYYAPSFKEIREKGGTVPTDPETGQPYFKHEFLAAYYMFDVTEPSGTNTTEVLMKNAEFKVTCDKDSLVEGERAEFSVSGYEWEECQKTMVVDATKIHGITEEELRRRTIFENGPFFSMYNPTDNATFDADVKLYIAPPGAAPTGDRAVAFDMHLEAIGIESLTLSPQTIGQNIQSIITLEYRPTTHTKGTLTFDLACSQLQFITRDPVNGIYKVFSDEISTAGHDAVASIYSSYIGTTTPLFTSTNKIYVQDIYFNIGFNPTFTQKSTSFFEGKEVQCYVDIMHVSEFRKQLTVNITQGADKIDEDWILERLHFSETTATDKIWFDAPKENLTFSATVTIRLIAKYVPEGTEPPYSQTLTVTCSGIEVTGVEWQDFANSDNYQIATSPYRKTKYFILKTLPYNNTKQEVLEMQETSPFSISSLAAGLSMNPILPQGKYATIANTYADWLVYGYVSAFSSSTDFGTVTKNLTGKSVQSQVPSTTNIVYPKHLTLYTYLNENKVELCRIDDTYIDNYVKISGTEPITPLIRRRVNKVALSSSTTIGFDETISYDTESVCFYITIADKTDTAGLNKIICSHFKASETDIRTSGDKDTIINHSADQKAYIRISLAAIGVTDPSAETEETWKAKISTYLTAQYNANTPVTIYYPLAVETETTYEDTLYYDNIFFTSKPYHIYTANNPSNQCSIEFVNNSTVAEDTGSVSSRIIFGTAYSVSEQNNKVIEAMTVQNVRANPTEIANVKFFSGTPTSIDQYDEDGQLLVKEDGTAEKGEVNIWENFSGKYEEWWDSNPTKVSWDIYGKTSQSTAPTYDAVNNVINYSYPDNTIVYSDETCETAVELLGYTWSGTWYGNKYEAADRRVVNTMVKYEFTGTENISYYNNWSTGVCGVSYAPANFKGIGSNAGAFFCSHAVSNIGWHLGDKNYPIHASATVSVVFMQMPHALLNVTASTSSADIVKAFKAYFAAQYTAGTPVTLYYPLINPTTLQDKTYYLVGSTHRKYTISKLVNDDDTEGDPTKTNNFNKAFVFNKDGTIPTRFFLSRFIPGWNQDNNTSTISMAKGLKSQQRTIEKDVIAEKGCYYKDDTGMLRQIDPIYYGPLMAYTWLSYLTYGSINLKNSIGIGASKTSVEAKIFADDSGTALTPGQSYNTVFILNNGLLDNTTYQNYDFNILGINTESDIALSPISCYKIKTITVGGTYTEIELGDSTGAATSYTAVNANEYYSLNACFSTTGYSETHYLDENNNPAISGYGTAANKTKYNNNRHPVRCLNIENMWGGGDYTIDGTGFVKDEEDDTVVHPILWNPEDVEHQSLNDINTWETETDLNVVQQAGTWDVGSFKYKNTRCAWVDKPAEERIPYRGYNVYARPDHLLDSKYRWVTGNYYDWASVADYQDMCGLGQTTMLIDGQSSTIIITDDASYQLVDYIENTSNSYIKTGFTNCKYEHDIQFTKTTSRSLMGHSGSNPYWGCTAAGKYEVSSSAAGNISPGNRNTVIYDVVESAPSPAKLYINGTGPYTGGNNYNTNEYQVFALTGGFNCKARLYSLKVYNASNVLVGEMYPCYRQSDHKPGLYDLVRKQFLVNAGGGEFVLGNNRAVAPDEDRYFKTMNLVVESSNKKSIDSQLKSSQTMKLIIDFDSYHTTEKASYFGGSRNADGLTGLNLFISTANRLCCENGTETINLSAVDSILPNTRHTIEVEQTGDTLTAKVDGTQTYSGTSLQLDTEWNYHLFTVNNCGLYTNSKEFNGSIYSFNIYKNNRLSRQYVHVYDKRDENFGLYDCINKKYSKYCDASGTITRLPFAYKEVEYLQSSGTQYINTGYVANTSNNPSVEIDFVSLVSKPSVYKGVFGFSWSNPQFFIAQKASLNCPYFGINAGSTITYSAEDINILERHKYIIGVNNLANYISIDGNTVYTGTTQSFTTPSNLLILALASGESPTASCISGKVYSCKIKNGTTVVRDFVPCYRKSDNKPGMYDVVNKQFYTNANTTGNDFTCGPEIKTDLNNAIQPVENMTFTPGQYVNTHWSYTTNSVVKISTKKSTAAKLINVFGDETASNMFSIGVSDASNHPFIKTGSTTSALTQSSSASYKYTLTATSSSDNINYLVKGKDIASISVNSTSIPTAGSTCFLGGSNDGTGAVITNGANAIISDCIIYENSVIVKHFIPAYNLVTKTYGMYELVNKEFYENAGTGTLLPDGGTIAKVEYVENDNSAIFSAWNFDTEIKFKATGKIVVDLDIETPSSDGHNKCINGSLSTTAAGSTYLSYSDNTVGGVSLTERTVDGSKVTWKYTYGGTDDATVHISAGATATDSGKFKFKRVTVYGVDGLTAIKDFVAASANGVAGFYDVLSGQFISNQNTGVSIIGPKISDSVPGDPGLYFEKIKLLTRIFGTL